MRMMGVDMRDDSCAPRDSPTDLIFNALRWIGSRPAQHGRAAHHLEKPDGGECDEEAES